MATTAAAAAVATVVGVDAADSEIHPTADLNVGFTGVMARYLASLEMAGCELEAPPEQFDVQQQLQQQQHHPATLRHCPETSSQPPPLVNGTSSPRRHQKVN